MLIANRMVMRLKVAQQGTKESVLGRHAHQQSMSAAYVPEPRGIATSLLNLQRTHGNHYVRGLLIGPPNDKYEQEANKVAERMMRLSKSQAQPAYEQPHHQTADGLEECPATARGSGEPLSPSARSFMEHRFGFDFSHVRIHTDSQAVQTAQELNAAAFTVREHIYFGSGRYVSTSDQGRLLLAHELTHVIQQRNGLVGYIQRQPQGQTRPATASEQGEFALAQREFVLDAIDFLRAGARSYRVGARLDEARLHRQLVGWKETLTKVLGLIETALNNDATLKQELRQVYQDAVQAAITTAISQLGRSSHELYQANRDNIHEWAWPQAVAASTANELSGALPEPELQRLRVVTTGVTITDIHDLFSTQGGTTTISIPANVTVQFASGIPQSLHHGLRNVAGMMTTQMTPSPLEVNSTITLALDLERYGGDFAAFRFTYVEHHPPRSTPTQEILIERLGAIGMEGLPPSQVEANQRKFDQHRFQRGSGWSDAEFQSLLAAISQFPETILTPVDGITFRRQNAHPTDPERGGDYNPNTHTITMYDRSFSTSMTRFGVLGANFTDEAVRSILHEIGHAIDLLPLRQAWDRLEQARTALRTAFAQYETPPGSGQYNFPSSEQASWNTLQQQITVAEQARNQARSRSGYRWQWNLQTGVFETVEGGTAAGQNAFRLAAQQDGGTRITQYSNKEWQEHFAESFSLYMSAPDTLRRLRPHVYDYFVANFPR